MKSAGEAAGGAVAEAVPSLLVSMRMANAPLDQFVHALWWKIAPVLVLCALAVVFIGLPLYWLRLKLEQKLIQMVRSARAGREPRKLEGAISSDQSEEVPHCPLCNSIMVLREARRGANAGQEFWGCSNFPTCRGTRPL